MSGLEKAQEVPTPYPRAGPCRISFKYPQLSRHKRMMLKPGKCCDSQASRWPRADPHGNKAFRQEFSTALHRPGWKMAAALAFLLPKCTDQQTSNLMPCLCSCLLKTTLTTLLLAFQCQLHQYDLLRLLVLRPSTWHSRRQQGCRSKQSTVPDRVCRQHAARKE